jgi:hypothetical protein
MMNEQQAIAHFWEQEIMNARLPDERYRPNLVKMCCGLQEKPGHSFSAACCPAVRKAAHRLFSNEESLDTRWHMVFPHADAGSSLLT